MGSGKSNSTLVIFGHVDSGKSTITEHLIQKRGENTDNNFSNRHVITPKHTIEIINVSGHRDFIKHMITGPSQADAALLVVSATAEEPRPGKTREYAIIAHTLGITQLIVAVNKIDDRTINWSQRRFDEVVEYMSSYLTKVGFNLQKVTFLPISGFRGDNMFQQSPNLAWYQGPTLLDALDALIEPVRPRDKPLRIPVQNVYKVMGIGTVVIGRVETGVLKTDMPVTIAPGNLTSEVRSIEMQHAVLDEAGPGDYIAFNVKNVSLKDVRKGMVIGPAQNPPREIESFQAQVTVLDPNIKICVGYSPLVHCHTARVACKFAEIFIKVDRRTGAVLEEAPEYIRSGSTAIVKLVPTKPLCLEEYTSFPALGRFFMCDTRQIVAFGVVKSVTFKEITQNG